MEELEFCGIVLIIVINCRGNDVHFDLDIGNLSSSAKEPDQVMRSGLIG